MKLILRRIWFTEKSTIGRLYIDDKFECYTLEDVVREDGIKVPGETAIPYGEYKVIIDFSNRFQRLMPHVLDVPLFEGIRIHAGNTDKDTEGCPLVGEIRGEDFVGQSRIAFNRLFIKMQSAESEGITITIEREVNV